MTDWSGMLDSFGRSLLTRLGEDPDNLPTGYNPVTRALKLPTFVDQIRDMDGFSKRAMGRVTCLCQMQVYEARRGPDMDGKPKGLRRHWYAYWKGEFAQPFAMQLGDYTTSAQGVKQMADLKWTALMYTTYAHFVDSRMVTYRDLFVADTSRRRKTFWQRLFKGCHILVAVEKDSLFEDFFDAATALGARAIYSGKGKSSKAGIELLLRQQFGWSDDFNPFTKETPLYVLSLSDWDFDGEAVIGPTFGEQARRYTPHVREARVGINPKHVIEDGHRWLDKWYQIKLGHSGYRRWAETKALFLGQCEACGNEWAVKGVASQLCPSCEYDEMRMLQLGKDTAHGFEVEALVTRTYYGLMVDALLQLLPFEYIVGKLRDECIADAEEAAKKVREDVLDANKDYQKLLEEFKRLNKIKKDFAAKVLKGLQERAEPHVEDWRNDGSDPTLQAFRRHVVSARSGASVWRPFKEGDRTEALTKWLRTDGAAEMKKLQSEKLEF